MGEAVLWGLLGASSLILGAEIAFAFRLSRMLVGLIMAFGVGALISSVTFELVAPAEEAVDFGVISVGLFVGAFTFFVGNRLIAGIGGGSRKAAGDVGDANSGIGIALGTFLDGIPESAVLGMSLLRGDGVSFALLAGIWISNLPESLGSTVNLARAGVSKRNIRLLWLGIVVVSAIAAGGGYALVQGSTSLWAGFIQAFAAGALLTMIADEMAPEAFDRSAAYAGLATVAGFALAAFFTTLET